MLGLLFIVIFLINIVNSYKTITIRSSILSSPSLSTIITSLYSNINTNTDVTENTNIGIDIIPSNMIIPNNNNEYNNDNDNNNFEDDEYNYYDDLLDLNKEVSTKTIGLVKETTINDKTTISLKDNNNNNDDNNNIIINNNNNGFSGGRGKRAGIIKFYDAKKKLNQKLQWDQWDAFMESELGDLDAEPNDNDKWILEMRDIVEQKRGYAIWSKRSDQEIKRATQKGVADKAISMPPSVTLVITSVYIERTYTMKQLRKDNELACIEFRKWMIEQRKKTKKDPLPMAKMAVTKKWLQKHPKSSFKYTIGKKGFFNSNDVVLDEQIKPVEGVTFSTQETAIKGSGSSVGGASSNNNTPSNTSTKSQLHTVSASMRDWEKQKEEIIDIPSVITIEKKGENVKSPNFEIDGVEMFVANNPVDDYFVVL